MFMLMKSEIKPQPDTHQFAYSVTRLCSVQEETVGSPFCECESALVFGPFVSDSNCVELGFTSKRETCVSRRILHDNNVFNHGSASEFRVGTDIHSYVK